MPPLPNRRNAELFLLGFATVITTVALLLVEANQEQGLQLGPGHSTRSRIWRCSPARIWRSGGSRRTPIRCCCPWWHC